MPKRNPEIRRAWLDANAVVYFLTGQPPDLANTTKLTMEQVDRGELILNLTAITIHEVVWVLEAHVGLPRREVAGLLWQFIGSPGIDLDGKDIALQALVDYRDKNVDFADAHLAACARASDSPQVITFDRDFDKLNVARWSPAG